MIIMELNNAYKQRKDKEVVQNLFCDYKSYRNTLVSTLNKPSIAELPSNSYFRSKSPFLESRHKLTRNIPLIAESEKLLFSPSMSPKHQQTLFLKTFSNNMATLPSNITLRQPQAPEMQRQMRQSPQPSHHHKTYYSRDKSETEKQAEIYGYRQARLNVKNYLRNIACIKDEASLSRLTIQKHPDVQRIRGQESRNEFNIRVKRSNTQTFERRAKRNIQADYQEQQQPEERSAEKLKDLIADEDQIGNEEKSTSRQSSSDSIIDASYIIDPKEDERIANRRRLNRVKELHKLVSKNKLVIVPDPKLNVERDMPTFTILEAGFKNTKKYRKYQNTVVAGDVHRGSSIKFMSDVMANQINQALNRNKQITRSEAVKIH